jgi:hypothetical protein
MPALSLICVEWRDPTGNDASWEDMEGALELEPEVCKTVGWLVARKEHWIIVASTLGDDRETFSDLTAIPHGCIIKSWAITEPRRETSDEDEDRG